MENTWLDKKTGLTWELKTPENVKDLFSWDKALKYAEELNKEKFAGFNDWRVPTIEELKTILIQKWNNGKLSENCSPYCWSSTTYEKRNKEAHYVDLDGGVMGVNSKNHCIYVRCVRG